ncbi:AI-2E family transporter [Corynebacterium sp. CCM 9185]|uniref:AI-2E family transporter n=1 Tax=Corynebacterium marambiense TaxID=2765364 RepID=A0ABS0VWY6_9CORY|nr:AI-2E family transporter [Corynebacterium marambiense]MBI9001289.1 AI-2E family transporter [Corynebacterium marambiense]MCK7663844.1 AI-2E family transporter [Corynebacterium marambiense]
MSKHHSPRVSGHSDDSSSELESTTPIGSPASASSEDIIFTAINGETDHTASDAGEPSAGSVSAEEHDQLDRAVIIGRDGRWFAGWALRFIIVAAASCIAWLGLGIIWTGVLPVLLAILLCTVLWPPVRWLKDHGVPGSLSSLLVLVGALCALGGVFAAMAPRVAEQSKLLFTQSVTGLEKLQVRLGEPPFNINTDQIDGVLDEISGKLQDGASGMLSGGVANKLASGVFAGVSTATSMVVTLLLMLVLSFFFLKDGHTFLPWVRRNVGKSAGWHLTEVLTRTWNTLSGFIRAQALVSLIDAIFIGIGLVILGVPLALVLAVITFFGGFIPIVGAISAGAIAVLVALVSNGLTTAIFVLVLIIAVQQIEGNILSPLLQSKAMNLHPVIVLLSITVGGGLFGIVGAFLAVPAAATVAVWLRYHAEIISLRSGERTIDEIETETAAGSKALIDIAQAMRSVRRRFKRHDIPSND